MYQKKNPVNLATQQKLSKMKANYKMKRAMEMDDSDDCTTLLMLTCSIKIFPQRKSQNSKSS